MIRNSSLRVKRLILGCFSFTLCVVSLWFTQIVGATPIGQELFEPSAEDDLRLGATFKGGTFPAAMKTSSGIVSASSAEGLQLGALYGASERRDGYRLDRFVQVPQHVQYDDPFRPSLIPYKRSVAYDTLSDGFRFKIASSVERPVEIGGAAGKYEDSFFAEIELELLKDRPVSLPTVGPNASLRAFELDPPLAVEVFKDSAENWWVRSKESGRAHALMQMSLPRKVFGSQVLPVGFASLKSALPRLPVNVQRAGMKMARRLGVAQSPSPAHALQKLVAYFRSFESSEESATGLSTEEIFYELTLARRGVCRHRAYAFALIALSIGIPSRFVHNEAHAWVEVFDSDIWHRIDLGGAPADLLPMREPDKTPAYRAPSDPYSWPAKSRPASILGAKMQGLGNASESSSEETFQREGATGDDESVGQLSGAQARLSFRRRNAAIATQGQVELSLSQTDFIRGQSFYLKGKAEKQGSVCALARIDIFLMSRTESAGGLSVVQEQELASLASDSSGRVEGQITLPADLEVGEYELRGQIQGACSDMLQLPSTPSPSN